MFKGLFLFSCALLSLALIASGQEYVEPYKLSPIGFAADITTSTNMHYQFPFFKPGFRSIDKDLSVVIKEDVEKIIMYLDSVISESLVPTKKGGMFKWVGIMSNLVSLGKEHGARRKKLNKPVEIAGEFNKELKEFMQRMLKRSKEIEKQLTGPTDAVKLRDDIHNQLVSIVESVKVSPVAVYMGWTKGRVDDQDLEEFFSVLMARLRYHGYGNILTAVDKLVAVVLALGNMG